MTPCFLYSNNNPLALRAQGVEILIFSGEHVTGKTAVLDPAIGTEQSPAIFLCKGRTEAGTVGQGHIELTVRAHPKVGGGVAGVSNDTVANLAQRHTGFSRSRSNEQSPASQRAYEPAPFQARTIQDRTDSKQTIN